MLELGSSGSVRGVSSNGHPYRDPPPNSAGSEPPARSPMGHTVRARRRDTRWLNSAESGGPATRRSSRAINEACKVGGTANRTWKYGNGAPRRIGKSRFGNDFRHFFQKQRHAIGTLDDLLNDFRR